MKAVLLALVLLVGGGAAIPNGTFIRSVEKPATVRLLFTDGSCSGTAVAASWVLTAAHCLEGGALVSVNGKPVVVSVTIDDGADHALIKIAPPKCSACVVFSRWATVDTRPMRQGQEIHLWAHPGGLVDMYRRGYVMGFEQGWILSDVVVYRGDSGAGIFDRSGRVVGVVSTMFSYGENFHGMGAQPFKFSREQLAQAGL